MDAALRAAFRKAHYHLSTSHGELVLHVDRHERALAAMLRDAGASCAALLTAFNPEGQRAMPFRNRRAQHRLQVELARLGYTVLAGRNEDPRRRWPVEHSLLVLGLTLPRALHIAARYGQAAFLWVDADGTPRLVATATHLQRRT